MPLDWNTMQDWLQHSARRASDTPFLITADKTWTFGAMEDLVRNAVGALKDVGVNRGDTVGVWARNDVETVAALFAVPRAGAVVFPVNTRLADEEILTRLRLSKTSMLIAPSGGPDLDVPIIDSSWLEGGVAQHSFESPPHDAYAIVYTSGTSGEPKGVRLTRTNLEASAAASADHIRHAAFDRWLAVLPLFHVGGLSIVIRSAREGSSVILDREFDAERATRLLKGGTATLASFVPTMLERVLDQHAGPFVAVKAVLLGGGPSSQTLLTRAAKAGLPVLATYGMTETSSQIATLPMEESLEPHRRVKPVKGAEVRVVNSQGRRLPSGSLGHIEVRGPMVFQGYAGEPIRRSSQWFRTGDLGRVDMAGYLDITGRGDEMIITGGENVHPFEVEEIIAKHPMVQQVAVVGVDDREWGRLVAAAVVGGGVTKRDLEELCREHLAAYKTPRRWMFLDELPRNALGKVSKPDLVKEFEKMAGVG